MPKQLAKLNESSPPSDKLPWRARCLTPKEACLDRQEYFEILRKFLTKAIADNQLSTADLSTLVIQSCQEFTDGKDLSDIESALMDMGRETAKPPAADPVVDPTNENNDAG